MKAWRGQCKKVEEGQYDRVGGGKGGGGEKVEGGWKGEQFERVEGGQYERVGGGKGGGRV